MIRRRAVGDGFHEELTLLNHDEKPVEITVRIEAGFRFRRSLRGQGRAQEERHVFERRRGRLAATRLLTRDVPARDLDLLVGPCDLRRIGLTLLAQIEPHGAWTTDLDVVTADGVGGTYTTPKYHRKGTKARPNMERSLDKWLEDAPRVESDWEPLKTTYRRSLVDLAALRFAPPRDGRTQPPCRRASVVHDDVRPRQHLYKPSVAAVHARARSDDSARTRRLAGHPSGRLSGRGSRPDPARDALRRNDCVRRATAFPLLRSRRRDHALRRPA